MRRFAGMPHNLPPWLQPSGELPKRGPTRWRPKSQAVKKIIRRAVGRLALRWGVTRLRSSLMGRRLPYKVGCLFNWP